MTDDHDISIVDSADSGRVGVNVKARDLVVFMPLVDRSEQTPQERVLALDGDVREAMAAAARRLQQQAMPYVVTGWSWDPEDIQYDMTGRTVFATMKLVRE